MANVKKTVTLKGFSEEELPQIAATLLHILYNLRDKTRIWQAVYGSEARTAKEKWEKKADEFFAAHGITEFNFPVEIVYKVVKKPESDV